MSAPEISILLLPESDPREGENLSALLPELSRVLAGYALEFESVVVSPAGNPAASEAVARAASAAGARVVECRGGYGDRFRAGLAACGGRYVITMDTDFSHPPALLRAMLESRSRADVLVASRYVPGAAAEMGFLRRVLSGTLNRLFRRVLDMPVADLSSGFRLYRREAFAEVELAGGSYDVLIEALLRLKSAGFRIEEMPFFYRPRRKGSALGRLLRTATSYLATLLRMWRLRNNSLSCDYDDRAYDSVIPLQRYWQRRRYRVVTGFADPSRLTLDIGCGSSRIARSMPHLIGLDVNLRPLRYLRRQGVLTASGSVTRLPFRDGQFSQVICSEVIEHLPESVFDFAELARVIAPGGTLIIGTPDYARWLWRLLERIYKLVLPEAHGKGHVSRYTAAKLREKLASVGIDVVARGGVFFGSQLVFKCVKREPGAGANVAGAEKEE